jgi:hypothetical protein
MSRRLGSAALAVLALLAAGAGAAAAQQPNPASAPDTAEGMSPATDTTSPVTPGVRDPASTPDTSRAMIFIRPRDAMP